MKSLLLAVGATAAVVFSASAALSTPASGSPKPPATNSNNIQPPDPYRWLETNSPKRTEWIRAQNRYSRGLLNQSKARAWAEDFFRGLNKESNTEEIPFPGDTKLSIVRGALGQPTKVIKTSPSGAVTTLFDTSAEKKNGSIALIDASPSPDFRYLVVTTAANGTIDDHVLTVIDIASEKTLEKIEKAAVEYAWSANDELVYTAHLERDKILIKHKLAHDPSEDVVFSKDDEIGVSNESSDSGTWFVIYSDKQTKFRDVSGSDTYTIDDAVTGAAGISGADLYYLVKGQKGLGELKKATIDPAQPLLKSETVIPEGAMAMTSAQVRDERLLLTYQMGANYQIVISDLKGQAIHKLITPTCCSDVPVGYDLEKDQLKLSFRSQLGMKVLTYDFKARQYVEGDPEAVLLSKSGQSFVSEIVNVTSANSAQVPVRITYRRGLVLDGNNPALLEGYGGFGSPGHFVPSPKAPVVDFLMRGGVYIAPALRGGNELGDPWHTNGRRSKKQNVFNDMIAAAEYAIARGYTSPSKLAITGASNGGLLTSAVAIQRPDLFRLAIPIAGVHDMLRKERLDPKYDDGWSYEYGSSDDPEAYKFLLAYSPIHNAKPASYPTFLIMVGENDSRVNPAHSYKLAAVLQGAQKGPNPILLSTYKNAGHFLTSIARQGWIGFRAQVAIWSTIYETLGVNMDPLPTPAPTPAPNATSSLVSPLAGLPR